MSFPPRQKEPRLEGHEVSKVTDLAVARSAREISRIAAIVDQQRGNEMEAELVEDQSAMRSASTARRLLEISRQTHAVLDGPLLSNPGWDILLDLFIQRSKGKRISIISVCIAANAPTSTVLRYLQALMDSGTIIKTLSPDDSQGHLIELSDVAYARMNAILS